MSSKPNPRPPSASLGVPRPTIRITPRPSRPKSLSGHAEHKHAPTTTTIIPPPIIIPPPTLVAAPATPPGSLSSQFNFDTPTPREDTVQLSPVLDTNKNGGIFDPKPFNPSTTTTTPPISSAPSHVERSPLTQIHTPVTQDAKSRPNSADKSRGNPKSPLSTRVTPTNTTTRQSIPISGKENKETRGQTLRKNSPSNYQPVYPTISSQRNDDNSPTDFASVQPPLTNSQRRYDASASSSVDRKDTEIVSDQMDNENQFAFDQIIPESHEPSDEVKSFQGVPSFQGVSAKEDRKQRELREYTKERQKITLAEINYNLVTLMPGDEEQKEDIEGGTLSADGLQSKDKSQRRAEFERLRQCLYKLHALGLLYEPTVVPCLAKRITLPQQGTSSTLARILSSLPPPFSSLWNRMMFSPTPSKVVKSEVRGNEDEEDHPFGGLRLGTSASRLYDENGNLINEDLSIRPTNSALRKGPRNMGDSIRSFAWHPYLDKWSVIASDDQVYTYNILKGNWDKLVLSHQFQTNAKQIQYCPMGGSLLAVACRDGVCLWNIISVPGTAGSKKKTTFSQGTSTLRELAENKEQTNTQAAWMTFLKRPGHQPVRGIQWSPCGRFLLSYTSKKLINPTIGNKRKRGSSFLPSFSSLQASNVVIWDVAKGLTPDGSFSLKMLGGDAEIVRWSPKGTRLFISCEDGTFSVWETATWTRQVFTTKKGIQDAAWNSAGDFLLMCDKKSSVIYSLSFRRTHQVLHNQVWVDLARWSKKDTGEGASRTRDNLSVGSPFSTYLPSAPIRSLAWNQTSERLVVSFQGTKPGCEVLVLFNTEPGLVVKVYPIGIIRGPSDSTDVSKINKPLQMQFQPNFHSGALLATSWSQGYVTYCPMLFTSSSRSHGGS